MAKRVSVKYSFPATKLNYLSVVRPDTEFNAEGTYQVTLVYPLAKCQELKQKIEGLSPTFEDLFNFRDNGDGTGQFKVKQNKFVRWTTSDGEKHEAVMIPTILNKDNTKYEGAEPWGGTIGEVGVVVETQKGARGKGTILALRLRGIRIHDLKVGGEVDPMFGGPVEDAVDDDRYEEEASNLPLDEDDEDAPI